jgi:Bacterial archaeo-eukaryotic release factor family 3
MLHRKDLDELLASEAKPAVSLYLPTHVAGRETRQNAIRLKNLVTQTAERLHAEWRRSKVDALLAPAHSLVEDEDFGRHPEKGLAVFVAPGFSRVHKLPLAVAEEAVIGTHFHIKPLLPIFDDAGPFWLLAISAKHTRFYQGSRWNLAEVEGIDLPQGVGAIADITQYENTRYAAPTGRHAAGLDKAQSLGEAPEELRKSELIELLRRIAAKLEPQVAAAPMPLILAAHPEIQGHFREIASWRELQPEGITANPEAMRPDELHHRAYAMIAEKRKAARAEALQRLNALLSSGNGKATTRPEEIVKSARYSRVDTLFISGDEHLWGTFDEAQDQVMAHGSPGPGDVDLLDYAALMTLRQGGQVTLVGRAELPPSAPAAAILRY